MLDCHWQKEVHLLEEKFCFKTRSRGGGAKEKLKIQYRGTREPQHNNHFGTRVCSVECKVQYMSNIYSGILFTGCSL